jgi:hypothetical protein
METEPIRVTKLDAARAQLVTALDLFVRDKDPISVHCLACGGGELIEGLAEVENKEPFAAHILQTQPHLDSAGIRRRRNLYWNAFKHFFDMKGERRRDTELLQDFNDTKNDIALYIAWHDYGIVVERLPVAAQVFQVWWYALNEDKLIDDAPLDTYRTAFPDITKVDRAEQKRMLRRKNTLTSEQALEKAKAAARRARDS